MSLSHAMQIGRSALSASQLGINVAGNNIANVATPGYSRQTLLLAPAGSDSPAGLSLGRGVGVRGLRREMDTALQARLWSGVSDEAYGARLRDLSAGVEAVLNELSDTDLSSELGRFFNAWSELANDPRNASVVVQQGAALAAFTNRLRGDLADQRAQVDRQLGQAVEQADAVIARIASLSVEISRAESGTSEAGNLRDQRDQAVTELAGLIDVTAVEQEDGSFELLVGSTPILLGGRSRGLELRRRTEDGVTTVSLAVRDSGQRLGGVSGSIGAMLAGRDGRLDAAIDDLDRVAGQLVLQVNRLHATGSSRTNPTTASASLAMGVDDRARALNDPDNSAIGALPFAPTSGGFTVRVTHRATGVTTTARIDVDLDGITDAGGAGTDDDTSAEDIRAAIDAVDGLGVSFSADGRLTISADAGFEFSFADDSSDVLAVLGVNGFFEGTDAATVAVRAELLARPTSLLSGRVIGGTFVENGTALAGAALASQPNAALGGRSIPEAWGDAVQRTAARAQADDSRAQSAAVVRESLEAQRGAVSGVSVDEETLDLLAFQRQYQGAARLISIADELTRTLIDLV